MLKHFSIKFSLIEYLERLPGYMKFMKDTVTKKRTVNFKDDDKL